MFLHNLLIMFKKCFKYFKGSTLCSFVEEIQTQNLIYFFIYFIYNINEFIVQIQKY